MDPGVVVVMAIVITVPIVIGVLLVEVVRSWVYEQEPLAYISFVVLGVLAAWPVGSITLISGLVLGTNGVFLPLA
jgi:hypothetical protein